MTDGMVTDEEQTAAARHRPRVPGAGTLAILASAWLLLMLAASRVSPGAGGDSWTATRAAHYLPQLVSASLVGSVAVGLAVGVLAGRFTPRVYASVAGRLATTGITGALVAVASAGPLALWYEGLPARAAFAGTIAVAAVCGGLLTAVRHTAVLAAGVAGALGVFVVGLVEGVFEDDLWQVFGAEDAPESVLTASSWTVLTGALVAGVAAGLLVYGYLRRCAPEARWPAYLVGGMLPGLLVLAAELLTRAGGSGLFSTVGNDAEQVVLDYFNATRINRGILVLFAGALTALLLFGRTLRPEQDADDPPGRPEPDGGPEDDAGQEVSASSSDGSYHSSS